jgi:hypothetical protein
MANPDRDTAYTTDRTDRTVYTRESSSTGWFVGIIVALALLAIGYLVFSANTGPSTSTTTVNNTPAVEAPATDTTTTPMTPATEAPPATETAPIEAAPATDAAPATEAPATEAPAADAAAPAAEEPAPAAGG